MNNAYLELIAAVDGLAGIVREQARRIAELEEWQRKRTKIPGQVIDETAVLEARIRELEAALRYIESITDAKDSKIWKRCRAALAGSPQDREAEPKNLTKGD